jgi:hypothetical protein
MVLVTGQRSNQLNYVPNRVFYDLPQNLRDKGFANIVVGTLRL